MSKIRVRIGDLKRVIREELKRSSRAINEARVVKQPPSSFNEFRTMVANALSSAGAPEDLVDTVGDLDYMGGGVNQQLYNSWSDIKYYINDGDAWEDLEDMVHDALLDAISSYRDPYESGPGWKDPFGSRNREDSSGKEAALVEKTLTYMF